MTAGRYLPVLLRSHSKLSVDRVSPPAFSISYINLQLVLPVSSACHLPGVLKSPLEPHLQIVEALFVLRQSEVEVLTRLHVCPPQYDGAVSALVCRKVAEGSDRRPGTVRARSQVVHARMALQGCRGCSCISNRELKLGLTIFFSVREMGPFPKVVA